MFGRKFVALWLVAALSALMLSATASAALTKPRLSFTKSGGATIGWSSAVSSPADPYPNTQAIRIRTFTNGLDGASAYTYGASENLVDIRDRLLTGIDRLGFDSKGPMGNGAPRISLGTVTMTDDGVHPAGQEHTFFLSAYYCHGGDIGGGWRTSDFADSALSPGTSTSGALGGCYVFDQNGNFYGPDGLDSAAVAYPNDVVVSSPSDWFLIQDEGPATVRVDRLTVERWMWVASGSSGRIFCSNPGCI
jgi:hypothetical protein